MKSDIRWNVVTVLGHELEARLHKLTEDGFDVVSVDRTGAHWTIIAHRAGNAEPKGKMIGFRPPEK